MLLNLSRTEEEIIADFLCDRDRRLNSLHWIVDKNGSLQRFP